MVGTGWAGYTLSQLLDVNKFDVTIISPEETSPYTPLLVRSVSSTVHGKEYWLTPRDAGQRGVWSV